MQILGYIILFSLMIASIITVSIIIVLRGDGWRLIAAACLVAITYIFLMLFFGLLWFN